MKILVALATVLVLCATAGAVRGQDFNRLDAYSFQHAASGWVFPQRVGELELDGEPTLVGSARDGAANYKDASQNSATVFVYSSKSDAADASYAAAKVVIEEKLEEALLAQSWSEGPFLVGKLVPLVGDKVFYKIGLGAASSHSHLYYFDAGPWIVKVRVSGPIADQDTLARIDGFVRELPWDSLRSIANDCSGAACKTDRPIAVHGNLIETIAALLVQQKAPPLFPKNLPACDAAAILDALDAEPLKESDGNAAPFNRAACTIKKGRSVNFFRLHLEPDLLVQLGSSPDGLSYRGPLSFVAVGDVNTAVLTYLRDGKLDSNYIEQILDTAAADPQNQGLPFATLEGNGKKVKLVSRSLEKRRPSQVSRE